MAWGCSARCRRPSAGVPALLCFLLPPTDPMALPAAALHQEDDLEPTRGWEVYHEDGEMLVPGLGLASRTVSRGQS